MTDKLCEHYFNPLRYREIEPELYVITWKCKKCGKTVTFRTRTSWVNKKNEQGGRSAYNKAFKEGRA